MRNLSARFSGGNSIYRQIQGFVVGFNDFWSFLTTVGGFFGLIAAQSNNSLPSLPIEKAPLSVRLALFLVFVAGIGWMIGTVIRLTQTLPRDLRLLISTLVAVVMAGLVAGLADWLVTPRQASELPQELFLAVLGAMFAVRCLIANLSASRAGAHATAVAERGVIVLIFTGAMAAILIFDAMGAR